MDRVLISVAIVRPHPKRPRSNQHKFHADAIGEPWGEGSLPLRHAGADGLHEPLEPLFLKEIAPLEFVELCGHLTIAQTDGNGVDRSLRQLLQRVESKFELTLDVPAFRH